MSQAPEKGKAEQTWSTELAPAADETRSASPSSELQSDIQVPNDLVSSATNQDLKPDDELQTAIEGELKASGLILDELSVRVQRGVVFLRGVARSQRAKQSASRLVRRVAGVTEVVNSIDVKPQFSVKPLAE
jgi:osmotically-inducible protein OsmY